MPHLPSGPVGAGEGWCGLPREGVRGRCSSWTTGTRVPRHPQLPWTQGSPLLWTEDPSGARDSVGPTLGSKLTGWWGGGVCTWELVIRR